MKHLALFTALIAGAAALPLSSVSAATVMFSGSQSNTNAPGATGGRCAALTVSIANAGPFTSTGSSNFGDFATTQSHCLDGPPPIAVGAASIPYYAGLFTYAFSDGDSLFGTYDGLLTNLGARGLVGNHQTFTITGGGGRFLGATGAFTGDGTITFAQGRPPLSDITFNGLIDAPGIPEPATWMMMLLGFGALGAGLRSRRHTGVDADFGRQSKKALA